VELGEAKAVRRLDHHDRGVRYVDANLDDRCRNQDLELTGLEAGHDPVLLRAGHAAVQESDSEFGEDIPLQPFRLRDGRFHFELLRILDERANDERLPPGVHL
jgi:hypothetical protein